MKNSMKFKFIIIAFVALLLSLSYLFNSSKNTPPSDIEKISADVPIKSQIVDKSESNPLIPTTEDKSAGYCHDSFQVSIQDKLWVTSANEFFNKTMKDMQLAELDELIIDSTAIKSGIGLFAGRLMRDGYSSYPNMPRYYDGEVSLFDQNSLRAIEKSLADNSSKAIVNAWEEGHIKDNTIFAAKGRMMFLFEFLIEKGLKDEEIFEEVLDIGYVPHYADLVMATQAAFSVNLINRMHIESGLRANEVLNHYATKRSLLNYAVTAGAHDLVNYWWQAESTAIPDKADNTALDLLAQFNSKYDDKQLKALTELFLMDGIPSNNKRTYQRIMFRISSVLNLNQQQSLEFSPIVVLDKDEQSTVRKYTLEIFDFVLELLQFETPITKDDPCFYVWGEMAVKLAIKKNLSKPQTKEKKATINNARLEKKLSELQNELLTANEIEEKLGKNQTIGAKKLVEEYRYQLIKDKLANEEPIENDDIYLATLNEILDLARQGLWDKVVEVANNAIHLDQTKLFTSLVFIAIGEKADWEIIHYFLKKGGKLVENTISVLIISDNAEVAQKLLGWGLDLDYKDPLGYDALTNAVKLKSVRMFDFLLDNGVYPDSQEMGLDALDFAIKDFNMRLFKGYFISGLLRHNVKIEQSHRQWAEQKKLSDIDAYLYLRSQFPQIF